MCGDHPTDTGTDPANCGACGTPCTALQLAGDQAYTGGAVQDARHVYFVLGGEAGGRGGTGLGSLMKIPRFGGAPVAVVRDVLEPFALAVDDVNVYFTTRGGAVMKAPLQGGEPLLLAQGRPNAVAIAVSSGSVYWVAEGDLSRVSTDGGPVAVLASDAPDFHIVADSTGVYWATFYELRKTLPDGETVLLSPWSQVGPQQLAVGATHVYFGAEGGIRRVSKDGGEVERVTQGDAVSIAVDGSRLYWSTSSLVRMVSLAGGTPVTLASDMWGAWNLALHQGVLTWVNMGSRFGPHVGFGPPPTPDRALMRLQTCDGGECR